MMILSATAYAPTQAGVELALSQAAGAEGFASQGERMARVAARRAFVEMKMRFMNAARDIPGARGETLSKRVRSSTQAIELWRLREELFDALDDACGELTSLHRQEIKRQLANAVLT